MALQEQHIAYKFTGGIETKMDSKSVPAARLLALENGVFGRAVSIQKRNGYTSQSRAIVGSTELVTGSKRLGVRDDELLQFTSNRCYSRHDTNDQWGDVGAVISAIGTDRPAVTTSSQQTMPDHVTAGGITAYAWEDSLGGVWWSVENSTTGGVLVAPTQADSLGQRPRCVAVGSVIHIYYAVPTLTRVMVLVVNPSTPAATLTATILIDDLSSANPVYDVCATTRTGTPALAVWYEHATTNFRIGYVTGAGVLGSPATSHPSVARVSPTLDAASALAVSFYYSDGADADRLLVAYTANTDGVVRSLNGGTTSVPIGSTVDESDVAYSAPTAVTRIALTNADGSAWAVFEETAADASKRYCVVNSVVIGGAAGTERTLRSVGLASRAFAAGAAADTFAVFVHDTTYFNVYLTFRLSDFAPAGRHLAASASGAPTRTHLSSVHVADNVASVVLPYKTRVASSANDKFTESALRLIRLDFDDANSHQTAQIGRGLYMAAACPQHYDGRLWTEQGFHVGPELISGVVAAGGSMTISSVYLYKAWYEWTDNQGEIHRGPESIGTSITTGGADTQVTLTLPTLRLTRKSNVRICVGRSLPGNTTSLYRVSSLDPTTAGAVNGYITNSTSSDTATFIDRMSDVNLILQERLYTTGGVLSNDPSVLGSIVASGKNRLFFTDASAGSVVRFSQRIATGFGLEVAPELAHDVDPLGGDITALYVMDDVVYAFKHGHIFGFNGDGPVENGSTALGGFSASQLITSNVGCISPSSIVLTPDGLMFQSAKGIYLLDRARQVSYVGSPAEAYNAQDVRRATVMPDRTQVVFLTSSGSTLLYDHLFKQWSVFTNHEGYDAVVANNVYHYLRTNDTVYQETVGEYSDAGARITLRLETAWLHIYEHLQGLQRFWSLKLLGTLISPHQLGIQYRTNYDEAWSDPAWLDATSDTAATGWLTGDGCATIGVDPLSGTVYGDGAYGDGAYGGTGNDVYQWRFGIHEAGQSIQFRFEDFEKNGLSGASFELTEMIITGGVKKPSTGPFNGARST